MLVGIRLRVYKRDRRRITFDLVWNSSKMKHVDGVQSRAHCLLGWAL